MIIWPRPKQAHASRKANYLEKEGRGGERSRESRNKKIDKEISLKVLFHKFLRVYDNRDSRSPIFIGGKMSKKLNKRLICCSCCRCMFFVVFCFIY